MSDKKKPIRDEYLNDLNEIMRLPAGRRVLCELLSRTGLVAGGLFTGNSTTFYNLGKRDVGVELYNDIMSVNPEGLINIMRLQLEEGTTNNE